MPDDRLRSRPLADDPLVLHDKLFRAVLDYASGDR
jgi:hypothetical protein